MTKVRCSQCGGGMVPVQRDFTEKLPWLGTVTVPALAFECCSECGDVLLPWDAAGRVEAAVAAREAELIGRLPVEDFVTAAEACEILGVTRQAFSQNARIRRGLIYSVPRGEGGERLYHRRSVELFKEKRDGRFALVPELRPVAMMLVCRSVDPLPGWVSAGTVQRGRASFSRVGAVLAGVQQEYVLCQA